MPLTTLKRLVYSSTATPRLSSTVSELGSQTKLRGCTDLTGTDTRSASLTPIAAPIPLGIGCIAGCSSIVDLIWISATPRPKTSALRFTSAQTLSTLSFFRSSCSWRLTISMSISSWSAASSSSSKNSPRPVVASIISEVLFSTA